MRGEMEYYINNLSKGCKYYKVEFSMGKSEELEMVKATNGENFLKQREKRKFKM